MVMQHVDARTAALIAGLLLSTSVLVTGYVTYTDHSPYNQQMDTPADMHDGSYGQMTGQYTTDRIQTQSTQDNDGISATQRTTVDGDEVTVKRSVSGEPDHVERSTTRYDGGVHAYQGIRDGHDTYRDHAYNQQRDSTQKTYDHPTKKRYDRKHYDRPKDRYPRRPPVRDGTGDGAGGNDTRNDTIGDNMTNDMDGIPNGTDGDRPINDTVGDNVTDGDGAGDRPDDDTGDETGTDGGDGYPPVDIPDNGSVIGNGSIENGDNGPSANGPQYLTPEGGAPLIRPQQPPQNTGRAPAEPVQSERRGLLGWIWNLLMRILAALRDLVLGVTRIGPL